MRAIAFSRDGKRLAAAGGLPARKGEVKIWDVAAQKAIATISGHSDASTPWRFSPDGAQLRDRRLRPARSSCGMPRPAKEIRTLRDHIDAIYALAFMPDGKRMVTGAADRSVKIWDVASGERLYTLSESTDAVNTDRALARRQARRGGRCRQDDPHLATGRQGRHAGEHADRARRRDPEAGVVAGRKVHRHRRRPTARCKLFGRGSDRGPRTISKLPDWAFGLRVRSRQASLAAGFFNGQLEVYDVR